MLRYRSIRVARLQATSSLMSLLAGTGDDGAQVAPISASVPDGRCRYAVSA